MVPPPSCHPSGSLGSHWLSQAKPLHCLIKSSSVKLVPSQVRSGFVRSGKSSLTNTNLKLSESSNAVHVDDDGDDSDDEDDDDHDDDDDDVESQLLTVK